MLLSRLLETKPRVLLLDEPTRGIDVGAKSQIYQIIDALARNGAAVLVISSELPEIVGISDRVLVMRDGHIVGEIEGAAGRSDHAGKDHGYRHQHGERARSLTIRTSRLRIKGLSMSERSLDGTAQDLEKASLARKQRMRSMLQIVGMLPILIILALFFEFSTDRFMSWMNLSIVAQQAAINIVLAAGMTFVILTGGIDLSIGSILAASAMIAIIVSKIPDYGLLGVPAALLIGLIFGLINGVLIAAMRLPPFIVTLGSLTAVRGVARLMGEDTTVFNPELPFAFIGNGTLFGVPWLVVIAFAVVIISWFILRRTVLGNRIYAVGGNPGCGAPGRHQSLADSALRLFDGRPAVRPGWCHVGGEALCRQRPATWAEL